MARTWKDQPERVRLMEHARKSNLVKHDHTVLGKAPIEGVASRPAWKLSHSIPKGDAGALAEHRAWLQELTASGRIHHWDETEEVGYFGSLEDNTAHTLRMVKFECYEAFIRTYPSRCTPVEDYDPKTRRDKVTGEWAACRPEWPHYMRYKCPGHIPAVSRSKVKGLLNLEAREVNGAGIDEYYDNPAVNDCRGGKRGACWC